MTAIRKEVRPNLLNQTKNRHASFVSTEFQTTEKFKYNIVFNTGKYLNKKLIVLKTICNKIIQKPGLWLQKIDFIAIRDDVSLWIVEALIEGFVINFIVWALIGWRFSWITMIAWGFAIKQLLSVYWRLRKDGVYATIPKQDE